MEIRETVFMEKIPDYAPFETYFDGLSMGVLDIETGGLSPESSQVILIGLLFPAPAEARWVMKQYFAEKPKEEGDLLSAFQRDYESLDFLITYNGRSFDLPFLEKRIRLLDLPGLPPKYNLDLYRLVKDHSDVGIFTPNLRQKTLENFLGLWEHRTDKISGGESVQLYGDYLITGRQDIKEKILLHNKDDVLQLFRLLTVLPKVDFHKAMFHTGFPLSSGRDGCIVENIGLKKDFLQVEGVQTGSPKTYMYYGEELPPFHFAQDGFSFSIPVMSHKDLLLVDGRRMGITTENAMEGYSVIRKGDELYYSEINLLIQLFLERIMKRWITEK